MATFKDSLGRDWSINFNRGMLAPLRQIGFNVGLVNKDPSQFAVLDDEDKFGQVLWVLCGDQVEKAGLTPEEFARGFDGPTIFAAIDAVVEGLADFTLRPAIAEAVKQKIPGKLREIEQATIAKINSLMNQIPSGSNVSAANSPASPGAAPPG